MKEQKFDGIYVYRSNEEKRIILVYYYPNYEAFARGNSRATIKQEYSENPFRKIKLGSSTYTYFEYPYVACNKDGSVIPLWLLIQQCMSTWQQRADIRWRLRIRYCTGRKKSKYKMYRRVKTYRSRKWADAHRHDPDCIPPRAKQNKVNLPDPWDDFLMSYQRNWKKYRTHQWKD